MIQAKWKVRKEYLVAVKQYVKSRVTTVHDMLEEIKHIPNDLRRTSEGECEHSGCSMVGVQIVRIHVNHGKRFGSWPMYNAKSIMGFKREENYQIWTLKVAL